MFLKVLIIDNDATGATIRGTIPNDNIALITEGDDYIPRGGHETIQTTVIHLRTDIAEVRIMGDVDNVTTQWYNAHISGDIADLTSGA